MKKNIFDIDIDIVSLMITLVINGLMEAIFLRMLCSLLLIIII